MNGVEAKRPAVSVRVDGREVVVPEGSFVLAAARRLGIEVPTLCDHPDLEPMGACRLCMVEITHADWKGWHGLVTACLYPVQAGLEVSTRSPAVLEARKGVLSLLAARCPGSHTIQALAARHGAQCARLAIDPAADDCILCGLCTRVCETYATGAITTASRGSTKRVSTFAHQPPSECVGCGACAAVCPTGKIGAERSADGYYIWERSFATAVCHVEPSRCVGCGACVEACPFAVPRVVLRVGGAQEAAIVAEHCRGCGACVGACPTGAIEQRGMEWARVRRELGRAWEGAGAGDRPAVLACARAALGEPVGRQLSPASAAADDRPDTAWAVRPARGGRGGGEVLELSCAGRASVPLLLGAVAHGASGVLVLGRHEHTCRFDGAEGPARERVRVAQGLLGLAGIEPERIRFVEPPAGPHGSERALTAFRKSLGGLGRLELPALALPEAELAREGLDATLALARWLWEKAGRRDRHQGWLRQRSLPAAAHGQPVLLVADLPWLDVAAESLLAPLRLADPLRCAIHVLAALGIRNVGIGEAMPGAGAYALEPAAATAHAAVPLDQLLRERGAELPRPPTSARVAIDGSASQAELVAALGFEPVDVGPDPLPDGFAWARSERLAAEERLRRAERAGAVALLGTGPRAQARWGLLLRHGAWRTSRVVPVLGAELAALAIAGLPLGRRSLLATPALPSQVEEVAP